MRARARNSPPPRGGGVGVVATERSKWVECNVQTFRLFFF